MLFSTMVTNFNKYFDSSGSEWERVSTHKEVIMLVDDLFCKRLPGLSLITEGYLVSHHMSTIMGSFRSVSL